MRSVSRDVRSKLRTTWAAAPDAAKAPAVWHRDQAFALGQFPGSFARASNGFCLLAGLALRRFFIRLATLHLTKNALALHRGMDADGGGGEIKRPPAGEADWPR